MGSLDDEAAPLGVVSDRVPSILLLVCCLQKKQKKQKHKNRHKEFQILEVLECDV